MRTKIAKLVARLHRRNCARALDRLEWRELHTLLALATLCRRHPRRWWWLAEPNTAYVIGL